MGIRTPLMVKSTGPVTLRVKYIWNVPGGSGLRGSIGLTCVHPIMVVNAANTNVPKIFDPFMQSSGLGNLQFHLRPQHSQKADFSRKSR
jgi:hypothetical protein